MGNGRTSDVTADRLFTGWRGTSIALFCLIMIMLCGAQLFARGEKFGALGSERAGSTGLSMQRVPSGWMAVNTVDLNGGGDRAGVKVGDMVRFDDPLMLSSSPPVATIAQITVQHLGHEQRKLLRYETIDQTANLPAIRRNLIALAGQCFCLLLGALVLLRGWGDRAALLLGIGLVGYPADYIVPWWALHAPFTPEVLGGYLVLLCAIVCILLFPAWLYHTRVLAMSRVALIVTLAITVMILAVIVFSSISAWWELAPPYGYLAWINTIAAISVAMACWWSWRGSRDALGTERNRFVILLLAESFFLAIFLLNLLALYEPLLIPREWRVLAEVLLGSVAFPLTLAYAVLRHNVVDLGFALNRTVVYGSVSAILLGSFGLIEWGVEHLLPETWVKASAWIDAGAAVLVYLAFHRVHDAVERRVEHLFFNQWQKNEDLLRRFVATAPHFDDQATLSRALADELARFAGGGGVALYRRDARARDTALVHIAGSWDTAPRTLPGDDAAYARMRAERGPLDLSDVSTDLPGVLALPMLDHGALSGLVLMDLKGNDALFRPDEVDALGHAVHDVGLAQAALDAARIEAENRQLELARQRLESENDLLNAQMTRLQDIIGERLVRARP